MTDKTNLVEIKKGETGTGLLIENDGFISMDYKDNHKILDEAKMLKEDREDGESFHCPYPFIVSAVFQKYNIKNANGRIYPENVLKKEVERYQQKIRENRAIGECNHPSEAVIDLSRVAMNIKELHWESQTLVGKMEILISEGFRKHGIISCCGDEVANLLLNNIKIGVSSRGLGSVTQRNGVLMVGDDYEIVCWDVVSDPSTPNAWIGKENEMQQYVENTEKQGDTLLEDKISKFNSWLND